MAASPTFPAPESTDQKAVSSALEAGGMEWRRGDYREAVRWLHRAADAAEAGGDDLRAVGLARIAADLMSQLEIVPESSPRDEGAVLASFDDFNDQTIVDAPAIVTARATQQSGVSLVEAAQTTPLPKVPAPPRPDRPPKPPSPSSPRSAIPSSPKSAPTASSPRAAAPRERRALRVAVLREGKSGRRLIAEVLDEGQALPAGASEALLVLVDPDASLSI
ncbi:MAG: hypothetical protein ACOY0T_15495 [Myxococcota bacterium]